MLLIYIYEVILLIIIHSSNLEHNITNIILVDASGSLNGSRVEAYASEDIGLDVICFIFA